MVGPECYDQSPYRRGEDTERHRDDVKMEANCNNVSISQRM